MSSLGKRWRNVNNKNRLSVVKPNLIKFWDYEKNYPVTPDDVSFGSAEKFWWKCEKCKTSHLASVCNRRTGKECPNYDHSETQAKNIPKERTLAIKRPNLSKYWHPTKNGNLTPRNISFQSHKKIWWRCPQCKKEWQKIICTYAEDLKYACPDNKCYNNKKFNVGHKSLAKLFPKIASEWHPTKNGKLTPDMVSYGNSDNETHWICKKKHEWQTNINNRTNHDTGCPFCSGRLANNNNCFGIAMPSLTKEWHPVKNGKLTPYNVTKCSGQKIHWICGKNHEWVAPVNDRAWGHNCPHCRKIILRDGTECDSMVEAYFYLLYKSKKIRIKHNLRYHKDFGRRRYDFYLIKENKYVEVTSFDKRHPLYKQYMAKIKRKKKFVEDKLGAKFEFIQKQLSPKEKLYVWRNMPK